MFLFNFPLMLEFCSKANSKDFSNNCGFECYAFCTQGIPLYSFLYIGKSFVYFCHQIIILGLLFYRFIIQILSMKSVVMFMHPGEGNFCLLPPLEYWERHWDRPTDWEVIKSVGKKSTNLGHNINSMVQQCQNRVLYSNHLGWGYCYRSHPLRWDVCIFYGCFLIDKLHK